LLMREFVHVKRGDHLVRMLELAVGVAFWWLPCVGLIGRQLRACEEACCDAAVVAKLPEARRDYAELLLDVIDFASPLQAAPQATAMSVANDLEKRVRAILNPSRGNVRSQFAGALVVGLACAIVPCQFHLGILGRPSPIVNSAERGHDAEPTNLPGDVPEEKWSKSICCPS
jgi:beta-lactamase regulating signal transducer with metallopeptidase domain